MLWFFLFSSTNPTLSVYVCTPELFGVRALRAERCPAGQTIDSLHWRQAAYETGESVALRLSWHHVRCESQPAITVCCKSASRSRVHPNRTGRYHCEQITLSVIKNDIDGIQIFALSSRLPVFVCKFTQIEFFNFSMFCRA